MSFSPAILYDILFLIVFSFAAVKSWQKGFLAGLAELIGAVLGVGIAVWGSRALAPEIYQRFFSDAIANKVDQAVAQSGGDMAAAVQGLDFLPESLRTAVAAGLQTAGDQLPEKITALLEPLFLPLVQVVLFVLLCVVVRWVFALLVRLLRGINGVPLVGGVNPPAGPGTGLVHRCAGLLAAGSGALVPRQRHRGRARLAEHRRIAAQRRVQLFWRVQSVFSPLLNIF